LRRQIAGDQPLIQALAGQLFGLHHLDLEQPKSEAEQGDDQAEPDQGNPHP
jgi:hypothetical protein